MRTASPNFRQRRCNERSVLPLRRHIAVKSNTLPRMASDSMYWLIHRFRTHIPTMARSNALTGNMPRFLPTTRNTKGPMKGSFVFLAERVGFEPTVRETRTPDFESGPFDHSGTSPNILYLNRTPDLIRRIPAPHPSGRFAVQIVHPDDLSSQARSTTPAPLRRSLFLHESRGIMDAIGIQLA